MENSSTLYMGVLLENKNTRPHRPYPVPSKISPPSSSSFRMAQLTTGTFVKHASVPIASGYVRRLSSGVCLTPNFSGY